MEFALSIVQFHLKVWAFPKYTYRAIAFKARYFASLLDWAVWGFGEKPGRVFATAPLVVIAFACVYFFASGSLVTIDNGNAVVRAVYFSLVTFTTLGYGDVVPRTDPMRLICGFEALLGAFTMGLVVAGFANRSRY
jgi:hypothetical protein